VVTLSGRGQHVGIALRGDMAISPAAFEGWSMLQNRLDDRRQYRCPRPAFDPTIQEMSGQRECRPAVCRCCSGLLVFSFRAE